MSLSLGPRSRWIVVTCCLAVVALATAFAVRSPSSSNSATGGAGGTAAQSATPTGPHTLFFGLAYGNTLMIDTDKQIQDELNEAVTLGVTYIRVDLPWANIQASGPGSYDWHQFDYILHQATVRGLHTDAIIDDVPRWARKASCASMFRCPPASIDAFAQFAYTAVKRYSAQGLHTWEIWNEENITAWAPQPDPAAYTQLLKATAAQVRRADSKAFVILGGMAAVPTDPTRDYISAYDFLTQVARLGGTRVIDAVGFHPYSLPLMPSQSDNYAEISSAPQNNLLAVLQQYGTPKVQIWLTETGAPVTHADMDNLAKQAPTKRAERIQAQYATNMVETVTANSHVSAAFWYSNQDDVRSILFFGLRRADGSYRPAFEALKLALSHCGCSRED